MNSTRMGTLSAYVQYWGPRNSALAAKRGQSQQPSDRRQRFWDHAVSAKAWRGRPPGPATANAPHCPDASQCRDFGRYSCLGARLRTGARLDVDHRPECRSARKSPAQEVAVRPPSPHAAPPPLPGGCCRTVVTRGEMLRRTLHLLSLSSSGTPIPSIYSPGPAQP